MKGATVVSPTDESLETHRDSSPRSAAVVKPRSRDVTDGLEAAAARGLLRAVGMGDEDFAKPQIGVATSWNELTLAT